MKVKFLAAALLCACMPFACLGVGCSSQPPTDDNQKTDQPGESGGTENPDQPGEGGGTDNPDDGKIELPFIPA